MAGRAAGSVLLVLSRAPAPLAHVNVIAAGAAVDAQRAWTAYTVRFLRDRLA